MSIQTFKYRLSVNKAMIDTLTWTLARCCELYNAALQERKEAWKYERKSISYNDQQNDLPEIKRALREEYQAIASHVLQDVLHRVDKAYQGMYARCKRGEKAGFPRFKSRNRYDSFTYPDRAGWKLEENRLHLTKIGTCQVVLHRAIEGKIKTCTIKREGEHWYCMFACDVAKAEPFPLSYEDVGIDLGVTHLATLSNGEMIEHPRFYRQAKHQLEQAHKSVSRKTKGSHRHTKAVKHLARISRKVRRQRKDFLHKASRQLVDRYQVLVFEDIHVANITRRPKPKQDEEGKYVPNGASAKAGLNKSILDAGWYDFVQLCSYKAESAGRTLIKVDPRYTSQICSSCGMVRKKDLSERWHHCECGAELDRDVNAAINILGRGQQHLQGGTHPTFIRA